MKLIKQLKFFKDFEPWYHKILNDFDFKYKEDIHARDVLHEILKNAISSEEIEESLKKFKAQFSVKKDILIYGCGPSLETTINLIIEEKTKDFFLNFINIAADGASVLLRKKGIPINAIFTDLDGASQKEIKFSEFKIIHSHGDNIEKIKESEDIIKSEQNVIGTTQTNPEDTLLLNPGGFTDGDRIIFFIRHLLTKHNRLFLIGMDFGKTIGIYSKPSIKKNQKANKIKIKKLDYAYKLIEWISRCIKNKLIFVNSSNRYQRFMNISLENFFKMMK